MPPSKPLISKQALIYLALLPIIPAFIIFAINHSAKVEMGDDFSVFWQAGHDFFHQNPIVLFYPPFAAFVFQAFALVPLKVAAFFFTLLNGFLLIVSLHLLMTIGKVMGIKKRQINIAVGLSTLAAFQFIWNNLAMVQVNFLVFFICVCGVYFLSKKKPHWAVVYFIMATFIKLTPIFLALFVPLFYRTKKVWIMATLCTLFCLSIPLLFRGLERGMNDYYYYYNLFIEGYMDGQLIVKNTNHNLKSFLMKIFYPESNSQIVFSKDFKTLFTLANLGLFIMALVLVGNGLAQHKQKIKVSLANLGALFIFSHLASGITWSAHLVSAMFFFMPLFLFNFQLLRGFHKTIHLFLMGIALFIGIEGSDTTGKTLYEFIRRYDIFVLFPLILFFYYSYLLHSGKEKYLYSLEKEKPIAVE
ncbi:glycosyltransferase family 87 protein [Xanthovirga aplysinae]|uniref:glycosyltransferase family 87 protein n=1 Tax=Xanthovirga aplysinae TaxID=2529853 RepID=UPI0012BCB4D0|nr:glycosyltransferase family 87 protein [Xanthovirga aplysinae]MTI29807.1 DUF2029 domain-containing protein [Xanthovirga aplysinae]